MLWEGEEGKLLSHSTAGGAGTLCCDPHCGGAGSPLPRPALQSWGPQAGCSWCLPACATVQGTQTQQAAKLRSERSCGLHLHVVLAPTNQGQSHLKAGRDSAGRQGLGWPGFFSGPWGSWLLGHHQRRPWRQTGL